MAHKFFGTKEGWKFFAKFVSQITGAVLFLLGTIMLITGMVFEEWFMLAAGAVIMTTRLLDDVSDGLREIDKTLVALVKAQHANFELNAVLAKHIGKLSTVAANELLKAR